MAYHNILSKLDRALVAYLISKGAGTAANIFPAKRSADKTPPCVVCWSESAEETAPNTGTYTAKVSIMVKTVARTDAGGDAETTRDTSDDLLAAVMDAMRTVDAGDGLADAITTAARAAGGDLADFTALDVIDRGPEAGFEEGTDTWIDTLNLEIVCCPSALA